MQYRSEEILVAYSKNISLGDRMIFDTLIGHSVEPERKRYQRQQSDQVNLSRFNLARN
jgi:hypothetical protein